MTAHEKFQEIYYSKLGMCGCGDSDEIKLLLLALLENMIDYENKCISTETMLKRREALIRESDPEVIIQFIYHTLNKAGILSHGTSISSAWVTTQGGEFTRLLKKYINED